MPVQTTNKVLMVRPFHFAFNQETAASNAFQQSTSSIQNPSQQAVTEFDNYVSLLRTNGIHVTMVQDTEQPATPDSIFPNNCFSTHITTDGERLLVLYPMCANNRRHERKKLMPTLTAMNFDRIIDLTGWEKKGKFLEGTGSLILDREHLTAYACLSPRSHPDVLTDWAQKMGYTPFFFDSVDENGTPVYHTNVIMHIGTTLAIVCLESIPDARQRQQLTDMLTRDGKTVIPITLQQVHHFAGNMLELHDDSRKLLVMSLTARRSLTPSQADLIQKHCTIISPDIPTIETIGGGSVRCMIAEIF